MGGQVVTLICSEIVTDGIHSHLAAELAVSLAPLLTGTPCTISSQQQDAYSQNHDRPLDFSSEKCKEATKQSAFASSD